MTFSGLLWCLLLAGSLLAQQNDAPSADTTVVRGERQKSALEGPVKYEAQTIDNYIQERKTILMGRAKVKYTNMTLEAARITVDWDRDMMMAEGVWDSVWVKEGEEDSVRVPQLQGTPVFTEGADVLKGEKMLFNLKTKKGRVLRGRTNFEDGFYSGTALKLVKPRTLNVADASFTTCDKEDEPHFHLWSDKMRIEVNKKIIAKPVVMYIGNIPVFALPFIYFPIQKERQSGIVFPRYGVSTNEGQYLRGLGYYWAASEYWDITGTMDYYEKAGFLFRGDLRYNVRYKLSGSISGTWTRKDFEVNDTQERRWDLAVRHNQTISPTMSLSVSGQFVSSGSFYQELSANREQRLQKEIRSNAKLSKKWGSSGRIELTMNQTRNLETDAISELLPQLTISNRVANLIPQPKTRPGEEPERRWYHAVRMSYNFDALLKRGRNKDADGDITKNEGVGLDQKLSMNVNPTLFGWLRLQPSINYQATMLDRRKEYYLDPETQEIEDREETGFYMLQTYTTQVSMNTKIYGLFRPRLLKNVQVRHVITPNISFSYMPDFSSEAFGYYQTVLDSLGEEQRYDRFSGGLFRHTPTGERQALSFNVSNVFKMKLGEGEKVKKVDLFNWNLSTSYNWKATEYRLSDLSSRIQATPLRGSSQSMSFSFNTTYSFYQVDEEGSKIDRLYVDDVDFTNFKDIFTSRWLRLTNLRASVTLRLKGRALTGGGENESTESTSADENADFLAQPQDRMMMDDRVSGLDIPWNLSATLNYSENRYNPMNPTKNFWARVNLDFNLTKNWKISYRAQWDLLNGEAVSQDFVFYRDLHCWEASIAWTPTGYNKRFYFRINVKSPMLKDIKVEKGSGVSGFSSSSLYNLY